MRNRSKFYETKTICYLLMISRRPRKRRTRRLLSQATTGDNRKRSRNGLRSKSRRGTTRSGRRSTGLQQGTDNSRRGRMIRDIGEASGRARRRLEEILHGRCCQRYRVATHRFCFARCRSTRRWYEPLVDVTESLINVTRILNFSNYYTSLI